MKVHILHIEYRHGDIYTAHSTKAKANAEVYAYVKENWDETGPNTWVGGYDFPLPKNKTEAIGAYFHDNEREFYNIVPLKVDE